MRRSRGADEDSDIGISAAGAGSSLAPPQPQLQPPRQPQPQAALAPIGPTQADATGLVRAASKSQNTGGYRLRKDRPDTAGRERPGTGGGTSTPGASPKIVGNAPLSNAAKANASASATAIVY